MKLLTVDNAIVIIAILGILLGVFIVLNAHPPETHQTHHIEGIVIEERAGGGGFGGPDPYWILIVEAYDGTHFKIDDGDLYWKYAVGDTFIEDLYSYQFKRL